MGRSSKLEQTSETPKFQENYSNNSGNLYATRQDVQPQTAANRGAISESESIGRDIKEGRLSGFVGHGTVLTGETSFQAMLRVDGHLTGRVTSENGTLIVGSTGRVDANIMVAAAAINGTINGDIIALEKVELGRTARVVGNIQTPRLVIEDGALFEGSCTMMKAKEAQEQRAAEAKSQKAAAEYAVAETQDTGEETESYSEAVVS